MLKPFYKATQDQIHVYIHIHAPFTNNIDSKIVVEGNHFVFVCDRVYVHLRLPGKILNTYTYTYNKGRHIISFEKETYGEYFKNLENAEYIAAPRGMKDVVSPKLEELMEDNDPDIDENASNENRGKYSYGFGNKTNAPLVDVNTKLFDLSAPHNVQIHKRHVLRKDMEAGSFSRDNYISDFLNKTEIANYLNEQLFWECFEVKNGDFDEAQNTVLQKLGSKGLVLTITERKQVLLGLIDILFAYCFLKRTTKNASYSEAANTINKLSATLSCFCVFDDTKQVLVTCYRRALVYATLRNFALCHKVKHDVVLLLRRGRRFVVKCLIDLHQMFAASNPPRSILNELYINDYIVFLDNNYEQDDEMEVSNNVKNLEIAKTDVEFELTELEYTITNKKVKNYIMEKRIIYIDDTDVYSDSSDESSDESSDDDDDTPCHSVKG